MTNKRLYDLTEESIDDLLGRTWHRTKCLQFPKAVINFTQKPCCLPGRNRPETAIGQDSLLD
jgi:hypothetical protein